MQIYLVKSAPIFLKRKATNMCKVEAGFFPAENCDQDDSKYCEVLENAFKEKHGSKACDLTMQIVYPAFNGFHLGIVQFWDLSDTLKTLKNILKDPEMTVTLRFSNDWITGPETFAGTEGMKLDTSQTFICWEQFELGVFRPHLDLLLNGKNAIYVTVLLNFNPRNIQHLLANLVDAQKIESKVDQLNGAAKMNNNFPLPSLKFKKSKNKTKSSDVSFEDVTQKLESLTGLCTTAAIETQEGKPKNLPIASEKQNFEPTNRVQKLENLGMIPEKLQVGSDVPNLKSGTSQKKSELRPAITSENLDGLVNLFEMSICKKILQQQIACDIVIVAKNDKAVKCHKSFLLAHSTAFAKFIKKDETDGLENTLEMRDISEEGVKALLAYLYYWDQTKPNDSSLIAFELLSIGYQYDISTLQTAMKTILLRKPYNWFDPDVTVKLFKFARKFKADVDELKIKAIKAVKENLAQVEQCQAYKKLFKENPEVAMELCRFAFAT